MLSPAEWQAVAISAKVAGAALGWILIPGVAVAWVMARYEFRGKTLVNGIVHLPLVLPPVVVGYLLLISLGREGWLGQWLYEWFGLSLPFTWQGAAVAGGVMAFPLLERSVRLSFETVDRRVEAAARTLGANRWRVFRTVTLPLTLPGLLTGAVLAFARALSEFGATITFAANIPGETRTLPLALYTAIQIPGGEGVAARLCVLSVVLAILAIVSSELLARRAKRRLRGADG